MGAGGDNWIRNSLTGISLAMGCFVLPIVLAAAAVVGAIFAALSGSAIAGWLAAIVFVIFIYGAIFGAL